MRFASLGGQSIYSQTGKAVANDAAKTFQAARRNSVDFEGLAASAMKNKSNENIAQIRADTVVKKAEIKEEGRKAKMGAAKAGVMRKAGVLAATGIAGLAEKPEKRDYSLYDKKLAGIKAKNEADRATMAGIDTTGKKTETPVTPAAPANTGGTGASNTSTTASSSGGGKGVSGGGIGGSDMDYMSSLVNKGYKPTQAAAIVGNMRYESGDFKFSEELADNAYGTRGYGALQWTNTGDSKRRDEFTNWSKNQGLATNSFEANAGFTAHEMVHGDSQGRSHWTGGGGLEGFKGQTDLNSATLHFAQNYLRPAEATANYAERQSRAQDTLTRWQQQNS